MKRSTSHLVLAASITLACGCIASKTVGTAAGDSVTNQNGLGTGTVAGVRIEVRDLTTNDASVNHSIQTASGQNFSESHDVWQITLGEVLIVFQRHQGQSIHVTIDGHSYGTLQPGDSLLIDENRTVLVNGVERAVLDSDIEDVTGAQEPAGGETPSE